MNSFFAVFITLPSMVSSLEQEHILSLAKSSRASLLAQVSGSERLAETQKMERQMEAAAVKMINDPSARNYSLPDVFWDGILEELHALLKEILGEKNGFQTQLNDANAAVAQCNTNMNTTLDSRVAEGKDAVDNTKSTHHTCRGVEVSDFDAYEASCGKLASDTLAASNAAPACNCPLSETDTPAVLTCLAANKNWVNTHKSTMLAQKSDCTAKTTTWSSKADECDADQLSYEIAVCQYATELQDMCSTLGTCFTDAIAARATVVELVEVEEEHLKAVLASAKKVVCFVQVLKRGGTETLTMSDFESCKNMNVTSDTTYLNSTVPDLNIDYTPATEKQTCQTLLTLPGDEEWADDAYSQYRDDFIELTIACNTTVTTTLLGAGGGAGGANSTGGAGGTETGGADSAGSGDGGTETGDTGGAGTGVVVNATYNPPTENVSATVVSFTFENLDYNQLTANETLLNAFTDSVKETVAAEAGHGVTPDDVEVEVSPGSVKVKVTIRASAVEPEEAGWSIIDLYHSCENSQQIANEIIHGDYGYATLKECKDACKANADCKAIDYYRDSGYCTTYEQPCENPESDWDGASSYKFQANMSATAALQEAFTGTARITQISANIIGKVKTISGIESAEVGEPTVTVDSVEEEQIVVTITTTPPPAPAGSHSSSHGSNGEVVPEVRMKVDTGSGPEDGSTVVCSPSVYSNLGSCEVDADGQTLTASKWVMVGMYLQALAGSGLYPTNINDGWEAEVKVTFLDAAHYFAIVINVDADMCTAYDCNVNDQQSDILYVNAIRPALSSTRGRTGCDPFCYNYGKTLTGLSEFDEDNGDISWETDQMFAVDQQRTINIAYFQNGTARVKVLDSEGLIADIITDRAHRIGPIDTGVAYMPFAFRGVATTVYESWSWKPLSGDAR